MNSYERVMIALAVGEPDRVPLIEALIDPNVVRALCPQVKDQNEFEDLMGLDAVSCFVQFRKISERSDGTYFDEWGVRYKPNSEVVTHPVEGPIRLSEDLKNYQTPDPDAPWRLGKIPELVHRYKGKKAIVFHQRAAFMWSVYLNGMENLLMNFLTEPEFAHQLMDKVLAVNLKIARNALSAGADIIILGDDYAGNNGPLFSPAVFKEFILPRLQQMVDLIHEEGGKVIKHSDGNLWPILDMIVDTGIDGLNPIEPIAGMDIGLVKEKYGKRLCLVGNIDCAHLLPNGSIAEVENAVRECIRKASPGGGHIISSSNSIHSSVKPENYLAMIRSVQKYGNYPMEIK